MTSKYCGHVINRKPFKTLKESKDISLNVCFAGRKCFASPGPGIIAEHLSTVNVWIDQFYFSGTRDQPSKGVAGKADISKTY